MEIYLQNIIVYGMVGIALVGLGLHYWRKSVKKAEGCGGDCDCGIKKKLKG